MNDCIKPEKSSPDRINIWQGGRSKNLVVASIALVSTLFLVLGLPSVLVLYLFFFRSELATDYTDHVSTDPSVYANVETLDSIQFGIRTYDYERNQYLDVLDGKVKPPKVADKSGRLPVLKFGGDIYIITTKWINESGGIAISDDPDFKFKLESFDHCFRVQHIRENLFTWSLDLERPSK